MTTRTNHSPRALPFFARNRNRADRERIILNVFQKSCLFTLKPFHVLEFLIEQVIARVIDQLVGLTADELVDQLVPLVLNEAGDLAVPDELSMSGSIKEERLEDEAEDEDHDELPALGGIDWVPR